MSTAGATLPTVDEHPVRRAPADLPDEELLVALANSSHAGTDLLADDVAIGVWWTGANPAAAPPPPTRRHAPGQRPGLAELHALRDALRHLAWRNNAVDVPAPDDLGNALRDLPLRATFVAGRVEVRTARVEAVGTIVAAAGVGALMRASARPSWRRLKACRSLDCGWVFLDASRNSSRRWCEMAGCGNRAKGRAFRERSRAPAP